MDWRLSFRPGFHFIAVLAVVGAFGSLLVVLVSPCAGPDQLDCDNR